MNFTDCCYCSILKRPSSSLWSLIFFLCPSSRCKYETESTFLSGLSTGRNITLCLQPLKDAKTKQHLYNHVIHRQEMFHISSSQFPMYYDSELSTDLFSTPASTPLCSHFFPDLLGPPPHLNSGDLAGRGRGGQPALTMPLLYILVNYFSLIFLSLLLLWKLFFTFFRGLLCFCFFFWQLCTRLLNQ